jgi:PAS domain S-box-containing protein
MDINGERRFKAIFRNAAIGIFLVDFEGKFFEANTAFCSMVGYSERYLKGICCNELSHSEDKQLHLELFEKLSKGEVDKYHLEKRFIHANGEIVWVRLTFSAIRDDEDGEFLYSIAVVENITQQKIAEQELEEMLSQRVTDWNLHDPDRDRDRMTLKNLVSGIQTSI